MAAYAKHVEKIDIVGQETGGNQLGLNGSFIFFLRLPNTKIELDIPVVNMYLPWNSTPIDGGVKPDIEIQKNPKDFVEGIDTELNRLLEIIETY